MRKFKNMTSFYITAFLLLSAVVSFPEAGVFSPSEVYSPDGISEENDSSPDDAVITYKTQDTASDTQGLSGAPEAVTEDTPLASDDVAVSDEKEDISYENDASQEALSDTNEEGLPLIPVLSANSLPFNGNENIYTLYFFSDNIGALTSSDSVNVYTFTLENRTMLRYSISHDKLNGMEGWRVVLYQEYDVNGDGKQTSYRVINALDTVASSVKDSSVELGLPAGEYRIAVSKGTAFTGANYKIEVETKDSAKYEVECNDNIYRYTEIYSSVPIKGSASRFTDKQDEDYFMFRMYQDGFVELKFEHPVIKDKTSVCWQIVFFSEDGTELFSANSLFSEEIIKSGTVGLTKGNYYVAVRNRVYADMTYTLTLTRTDEVGYENEQNDTMKTANTVALNSTVIGSVSEKTGSLDRDYFKFTVSSPGFAVVEFSHTPISGEKDKQGWNYVLLDSTGKVLFSGISQWGDDVCASRFIGISAGTYYIRVDSENLYHNPEKYYLSLSFTEDSGWESESNDSFEKADIIPDRTPIYGIISDLGAEYDYDFYSFEIDDASDVTVALAHEVLDYSKDIFVFTLYDGERNAVAEFREDGEGAVKIKVSSDSEYKDAVYKSLEPGKYYIRVSSGIFYSDIRYSLNIVTSEN